MIRVLVVDDHDIVRAGVARLLELDANIEVVGQAGRGHDGVRLCRELKPDVVLLDYSLPDLDGLETARQIHDWIPETRILILTAHKSADYATRVLQAGARGYVIKGSPAEELISAIKKVARGGKYVTPEIMEQMIERLGQPTDEAPEAVLSDREMQVLLQIARGKTTKEISHYLSLSVSTVETYRARMMEKLGLKSTADIVRFAIRRKLIDADEPSV